MLAIEVEGPGDDVEAAGDSWQIALDTMEAGVGDRAALEMKLQDIGASSDNGTES